jgi:ElaB/YqjD/DUF883 family membrane-anchored ribosome-binding protein
MSSYDNALRSERPTAIGGGEHRAGSGTFDQIKTTVSHKLNQFADTISSRADSAQGGNRQVAEYGAQAADWMKRSAHYIEEMDPQRLKDDITGQVRRNPGKTLLIATAAGLLLGSLLRRR